MNVTILDDSFDTLRTMPCFGRLAGHDVTIWQDHVEDTDAMAEPMSVTRSTRTQPDRRSMS